MSINGSGMEQAQMTAPECQAQPSQLTLIEGVRKPRNPKTCGVCGATVERRWRCQGCGKNVCDNCGGENQEGDWFCNPCYDYDD